MAGLHHGLGNLRITLQCHRHPEQCDRYRFTLEKIQQAPHPYPGPVFVGRFHTHMPLTGPGLCPDDLRQKRLGRRITVQDAVFTAFFVVEDELQGKSCTTGPIHWRYYGTVSNQVAWIVVNGCCHRSRSDRQHRLSRSGDQCCGHNRALKIFSISRKKCLKLLLAEAGHQPPGQKTWPGVA